MSEEPPTSSWTDRWLAVWQPHADNAAHTIAEARRVCARVKVENAFNTLTPLPETQFDRHEIDATSALAQGVEILLTRGNERLQLSTTEPGSQLISLFYTLNVRISRDFEVRPGDITVFTVVANLYDRSNPCCIEHSLGPGTGGVLAMLARERHWLPLVPSLGVVWRF